MINIIYTIRFDNAHEKQLATIYFAEFLIIILIIIRLLIYVTYIMPPS